VIIRTDPKTRAVMTASLVGLICVTATLGAVAMSGLIRNASSPRTITATLAPMIAGLVALLVRVHRDHVVLLPEGIDVIRAFWPVRHAQNQVSSGVVCATPAGGAPLIIF
jgi:hypothetical protein